MSGGPDQGRSVPRKGTILFAAICFAGFIFAACSTFHGAAIVPPRIEGAEFVGNRVCADCHTNITRVFPASAHGKFNREDLKFASVTGCESCHGPGSRHVQGGGGRGRFIVNPAKDATVCFDCHLNVHAEFNLPQHHPVIESRMNCVQCHDPHGHDAMKPRGGLAMARLNESCAQCHREQARPFVFEHEAMREGCAACHHPHGSVNRQLLAERDNNLCLKCHVQMASTAALPGEFHIGKVNHAQYIRRGTCWSAGCHSAVHGSNVNPLMLY